MPELPEVETMVRGLKPVLEGSRIASLRALDASMLVGCTPRSLARRARGARVRGVARRGKWVALGLEGRGGVIVVQPRMTGGFWLVQPPREGHVRLRIELEASGGSVWFCDPRRLGRIAWYRDDAGAGVAFAGSHGPDALEVSLEELAPRLAATGRAIKPTLMDQKVVAGIGNIYADEILFRARVHPLRGARDLAAEEVRRLHAAIRPVLAEAIEAEGSSFDAGYRTVLGLEGGFLARNAMYGRAGEPCPGCGGPVVKTYLKGLSTRPTHLCPTCQVGPDVSPAPGRRARGSAGRGRRDRLG
jgi:formamidopyrimidine-DNA glycosylase